MAVPSLIKKVKGVMQISAKSSGKAQLRRECRVMRDAIVARDMSRWSERATGYLVDLIRRLRFSGAVAGYYPMGSEIDCLPALKEFSRRGMTTALPCVVGSGKPLIFRRWKEGEPLLPGRFGTSEPDMDQPQLNPDLLIVPMLAFDRSGYRLGYGAGYYDITLAALKRQRPTLAVGLAYANQELADLPHESHDVPLDWIVTDKGARECRPG